MKASRVWEGESNFLPEGFFSTFEDRKDLAEYLTAVNPSSKS